MDRVAEVARSDLRGEGGNGYHAADEDDRSHDHDQVAFRFGLAAGLGDVHAGFFGEIIEQAAFFFDVGHSWGGLGAIGCSHVCDPMLRMSPNSQIIPS
jgi:hypothetical protein